MPSTKILFTSFIFGLSVLCGIGLSVRLVLRVPRYAKGAQNIVARPSLIVLVVVVLIAYSVFNTLCEPQNIEFWIAPLPFMFMALAAWVVQPQWDLLGRMLAWAFDTWVAICNLVGSVLPQTDHNGDFWYQVNLI